MVLNNQTWSLIDGKIYVKFGFFPQIQIKKMKSNISVVLFTLNFVLYTLQMSQVIIKSDLMNQILINGEPGDIVTQNTYNYTKSYSNPQGAIWIWDSDPLDPPNYQERIFVEQFFLYCDSPITLTATADNQFTAWINGIQVLSGNDWRRLYSNSISSSLNVCGMNQFKIRGKNSFGTFPGNPAGVIYAITQDDSCRMFDSNPCCPDNANFIPGTTTCQCDYPYVWNIGQTACVNCPVNKYTTGYSDGSGGCLCEKPWQQIWIPEINTCIKMKGNGQGNLMGNPNDSSKEDNSKEDSKKSSDS